MMFREFAAANRARCESPQGFNHQLSSWSASDWMVAVGGELGEAMNVVKKLNRARDGIPGNTLSELVLRDHLRDEVADTVTYLDLFAQSQGFSLEDAVIAKFDAKSMEIGYPHLLVPAAAAVEDPPLVMRLNDGRTIPADTAHCGHCGNEWFVPAVSDEWMPNYCCYCGTKFVRVVTDGVEREHKGAPESP